jgi:hypothetical protein
VGVGVGSTGVVGEGEVETVGVGVGVGWPPLSPPLQPASTAADSRTVVVTTAVRTTAPVVKWYVRPG